MRGEIGERESTVTWRAGVNAANAGAGKWRLVHAVLSPICVAAVSLSFTHGFVT